jgi:hypothetical protein
MTAKLTTAIAEPAAPASPPTILSMGRLPYSIDLFGNSLTVFAQAAVLIRAGFVFASGMPPMIYPNGTASAWLVLGSPEQAAFVDAMEAANAARAAEEAEFDSRVQAAARQIVDAEAKAKRDAEIQARIAEQKRALAALEAAAGAA